MKDNTVIFNPAEKEVLLHSLFEEDLELQRVMGKIIADFEALDLEGTIEVRHESLSHLTSLIENHERYLPLLSEFYGACYGFKKDISKKGRLEAGIYYTICKILLVRCEYRVGFNKLMYAATIPDLPAKFIYLYLARLGGIYIEQGKIKEAGDVLKLAARRCEAYSDDQTMGKLELLVFYQLLRVNIIQGDLIEAKRFLENIDRKLKPKERKNIILASLRGYYYRWAGELGKALDVLNEAYDSNQKNDKTKRIYARSWFNVMYQLACCHLERNEEDGLEQADKFIKEALSITRDYDYRNLGYCENTLGLIAMQGGNLEKGLEHFTNAWKLFDRYCDYRNMARSKRNMGTVLMKMKRYQEAKKRFNQSLDYDHHTQLEIGVFLTLLQKIDLGIELTEYYKAREYLTRIEKIKLPLNHFLLEKIEQRKTRLADITCQEGIIGESEAAAELRNDVKAYTHLPDPVLITGESGTGKSFVAQELHKQSGRPGKFITINCRLIPDLQLDWEIFGNPSKDKPVTGTLEKAHEGTVFFKEICDLPLRFQAKLSRFIDEKKLFFPGAKTRKELDVKIILATEKNIEERIAGGSFSGELYDRISDFIIRVAPLRERREDIRKLAEYFYVTECKSLNKQLCGIQTCAMSMLKDYPWPGNIAELQKTIKRCVVKIKDDQPVTRSDILNCLDNQTIFSPVILEKEADYEPPKEGSREDIISRILDLEEKLQKEEPPRTRATDSYRIINDVFKIIQEKGPVRKSEVVVACPDAEKSFHHWINILKDKHKVITVEDIANYKAYKAASQKILDKMRKAGELMESDNVYLVIEP